MREKRRKEESVEGEGEEIGNGSFLHQIVWWLTWLWCCWRNLLACTSCPWPIDTASYAVNTENTIWSTRTLPALDNLLSSFFLDKLSMALVGSDPMDRKQTMGTRGLDSSHTFSMSRITPSANFTPMASAMYLRAWAAVRSGHQDLNHIQLLLSAVELLCEAVTLSVAAF